MVQGDNSKETCRKTSQKHPNHGWKQSGTGEKFRDSIMHINTTKQPRTRSQKPYLELSLNLCRNRKETSWIHAGFTSDSAWGRRRGVWRFQLQISLLKIPTAEGGTAAIESWKKEATWRHEDGEGLGEGLGWGKMGFLFFYFYY